MIKAKQTVNFNTFWQCKDIITTYSKLFHITSNDSSRTIMARQATVYRHIQAHCKNFQQSFRSIMPRNTIPRKLITGTCDKNSDQLMTEIFVGSSFIAVFVGCHGWLVTIKRVHGTRTRTLHERVLGRYAWVPRRAETAVAEPRARSTIFCSRSWGPLGRRPSASNLGAELLPTLDNEYH